VKVDVEVEVKVAVEGKAWIVLVVRDS